jgi:predicted CopG family antitoxin
LQYSWWFLILTSAPEEEPPRSHPQATHWETEKNTTISLSKPGALSESKKTKKQNAASQLLDTFQQRKTKSQEMISRLKSSPADRDIKEFIKPILKAKMIILNILGKKIIC